MAVYTQLECRTVLTRGGQGWGKKRDAGGRLFITKLFHLRILEGKLYVYLNFKAHVRF